MATVRDVYDRFEEQWIEENHPENDGGGYTPKDENATAWYAEERARHEWTEQGHRLSELPDDTELYTDYSTYFVEVDGLDEYYTGELANFFVDEQNLWNEFWEFCLDEVKESIAAMRPFSIDKEWLDAAYIDFAKCDPELFIECLMNTRCDRCGALMAERHPIDHPGADFTRLCECCIGDLEGK